MHLCVNYQFGFQSTTSLMVAALTPHTVCVRAIKWPSFHMISSFVASLYHSLLAHAQFHRTRSVSQCFCTRSLALNTIKAEVSVVFV